MTGKACVQCRCNFFFFLEVFSANEDSQLYYHVWVGKLRQGEVTSLTQGCSSVKWCGQDGGPGVLSRASPRHGRVLLPCKVRLILTLVTKASRNKELSVCRMDSQPPTPYADTLEMSVSIGKSPGWHPMKSKGL